MGLMEYPTVMNSNVAMPDQKKNALATPRVADIYLTPSGNAPNRLPTSTY